MGVKISPVKMSTTTAQTQSASGLSSDSILSKYSATTSTQEKENKNNALGIAGRGIAQLLPSVAKGTTSAIDSIADAPKTMLNTIAQKRAENNPNNAKLNWKAAKAEDRYKTAAENHVLGKSVQNWEQKVDEAQAKIVEDNPNSKLAKGVNWGLELGESLGEMVPTIAASVAAGGIAGAAGAGAAVTTSAAKTGLAKATAKLATAEGASKLAGLGAMFMNVYDKSVDDSVAQGYDYVSSGKKAFNDAMLEVGTELMFGGIAGLGEGVVSKAARSQAEKRLAAAAASEGAEKVIKLQGVKNAGLSLANLVVDVSKMAEKKNVKGLLVRAFGEGAEEMISEFFGPYIERATTNPNASNATINDMLLAGAGGALMSFAMAPLGKLHDSATTTPTDVQQRAKLQRALSDVQTNIALMRNLVNGEEIGEVEIQATETQLGRTLTRKGVDNNIGTGILQADRRNICNKIIDEVAEKGTIDAVSEGWRRLAPVYDEESQVRMDAAANAKYENEVKTTVADMDRTVIKAKADAEKANTMLESANKSLAEATATGDKVAIQSAEESVKLAKETVRMADAAVAKATDTAKSKADMRLKRKDAVAKYGQEAVDAFTASQRYKAAQGKRAVVQTSNGETRALTAEEYAQDKYGKSYSKLSKAQKAEVEQVYVEYKESIRKEQDAFVKKINEQSAQVGGKIKVELTDKLGRKHNAQYSNGTIYFSREKVQSEGAAYYYLSHEVLHNITDKFMSNEAKASFYEDLREMMGVIGVDYNSLNKQMYSTYGAGSREQAEKRANQKKLSGNKRKAFIESEIAREVEEETYARFMQTAFGSESILQTLAQLDNGMVQTMRDSIETSSLVGLYGTEWDLARLSALDKISKALASPVDAETNKEKNKVAASKAMASMDMWDTGFGLNDSADDLEKFLDERLSFPSIEERLKSGNISPEGIAELYNEYRGRNILKAVVLYDGTEGGEKISISNLDGTPIKAGPSKGKTEDISTPEEVLSFLRGYLSQDQLQWHRDRVDLGAYSNRALEAAYDKIASAIGRYKTDPDKWPAGVKEKLQWIVDEVAARNGYDSQDLYHGTPDASFTKFNLESMDDGISIFLSNNPAVAASYLRRGAADPKGFIKNPSPKIPKSEYLRVLSSKESSAQDIAEAYTVANRDGYVATVVPENDRADVIDKSRGLVAESIGDLADGFDGVLFGSGDGLDQTLLSLAVSDQDKKFARSMFEFLRDNVSADAAIGEGSSMSLYGGGTSASEALDLLSDFASRVDSVYDRLDEVVDTLRLKGLDSRLAMCEKTKDLLDKASRTAYMRAHDTLTMDTTNHSPNDYYDINDFIVLAEWYLSPVEAGVSGEPIFHIKHNKLPTHYMGKSAFMDTLVRDAIEDLSVAEGASFSNPGIYRLRVKVNNPFIVNAMTSYWNDISYVPKELEAVNATERTIQNATAYDTVEDLDFYDVLAKHGVSPDEYAEMRRVVERIRLDIGGIEPRHLRLTDDGVKYELKGTTRGFSQYAKGLGVYDGVIFSNIVDVGGPVWGVENRPDKALSDVYIVFDPNNVKSVEPATFDDNGYVIPISQRFDMYNGDIRYSSDIEDYTEMTDERLRQYEELTKKYGSDKNGVPKGTANGKVSETASKIIGDEDTPEAFRNVMKNELLNGVFSHIVLTDENAKAEAKQRIDSHTTISQAYTDAVNNTFDGKHVVNKYDIVYGEQLITDMAQRIRDIEAGNVTANESTDTTELFDQLQKLIAQVCTAGTRAGQNLQAFSLLKRLTPTGRLYYINSQVNAFVSEMTDRNGRSKIGGYKFKNGPDGTYIKDINGNYVPLTVSAEAQEMLTSATTQQELDEAEEFALTEIAAKIPPSLEDRVVAWRYLAMLGNPRTHIRNMVSNYAMGVTVAVKDKIAGGLEDVLLKGRTEGRTKTAKSLSKESRAAFDQFIEEDWKNGMKDQTLTGSKLSFENRLNEKRRKLDGSLDKISKKNTELLELEDEKAAKRAYKRAFLNYVAANDLTVDYLSSNTIEANVALAQAHKYSSVEAQKATYRDASTVATILNQLEGKNTVSKIIVGGLMPFKKTPINILARGVQYSPVGLINGIKNFVVASTSTNKISVIDADGNIKTLTKDSYAKEKYSKSYDQLDSKQRAEVDDRFLLDKYSKDFSPTDNTDALDISKADDRRDARAKQTLAVANAVDQLAAGLTGTGILILGALLGHLGQLKGAGSDDETEEYYDQMLGNQEYSITIGGKNITLDWLTPLSMPLFTGAAVAEAIDNEGDVEFPDLIDALGKLMDPVMNLSVLQGINDAMSSYDSGLSKVLFSSAEGFVSQFIPTASGQIARSVDETRRTTYAPKDAEGGKEFATFLNKLKNKIPGVSQTNAAYVDQWGRTETNSGDNFIARLFNNSVVPWYTRDVNKTVADDYITALRDATGDTDVIPESPKTYYTFDNETFYLASDEYQTTKELVGQLSNAGVTSLMAVPGFGNLTAVEQAELVSDAYSFAKSIAKADYATAKGIAYDESSSTARLRNAVNSGMSIGMALYVQHMTSGMTADKDSNGKTIKNSKKEKVYNFYVSMGLTKEQIAAISTYDYE